MRFRWTALPAAGSFVDAQIGVFREFLYPELYGPIDDSSGESYTPYRQTDSSAFTSGNIDDEACNLKFDVSGSAIPSKAYLCG